jgi:hypothetical protein
VCSSRVFHCCRCRCGASCAAVLTASLCTKLPYMSHSCSTKASPAHLCCCPAHTGACCLRAFGAPSQHFTCGGWWLTMKAAMALGSFGTGLSNQTKQCVSSCLFGLAGISGFVLCWACFRSQQKSPVLLCWLSQGVWGIKVGVVIGQFACRWFSCWGCVASATA